VLISPSIRCQASDCPRRPRGGFWIRYHIRSTSATLHEESNCEDCDYHCHGGFNYCCQRHWRSPLRGPAQSSKAACQPRTFRYSRDVNKRHTNTDSIAEVMTAARLTSLASPCRAKGTSQTFGRYGQNDVFFGHYPVLVGTSRGLPRSIGGRGEVYCDVCQ